MRFTAHRPFDPDLLAFTTVARYLYCVSWPFLVGVFVNEGSSSTALRLLQRPTIVGGIPMLAWGSIGGSIISSLRRSCWGVAPFAGDDLLTLTGGEPLVTPIFWSVPRL